MQINWLQTNLLHLLYVEKLLQKNSNSQLENRCKEIQMLCYTIYTDGIGTLTATICCRWPYLLLQIKYILFVGGNTASTDDIKMRQEIKK